MKKIIGTVLLFIALLTVSCTSDQRNKISRSKQKYLSGNYEVTTVLYNNIFNWKVEDGKVTTEPEKGYYFFYDVKGDYIQVPINRTIVKEVN